MTKLTPEGKERLPDFVKFAKHLIASEDIDPLYPVLKELQKDMPLKQQLWHSFLYVAWYNLPSATVAFNHCPEPSKRLLKVLNPKWPTGIERRNNRGGKVAQHIASYLETVRPFKAQYNWYTMGLKVAPDSVETREENWRVLNDRLQTLHGNGRWAAYKHCEVLRKVNGLPVQAPDMGQQNSSGPREGLAMLFGEIPGQTKEVIDELNAQGDLLVRMLQKRGLEVGQEEVETVLCNWKSLMKGKYYVGHDIDELQEQIVNAHLNGYLTNKEVGDLFAARATALPSHYLGEVSGWQHVDKSRMIAYKEDRKIVVRKERSK